MGVKVTTVRNVAAIVVTTIVVVLVLSWYFTRDPLPPSVTLATGERGGQYYKLGTLIKAGLEKRIGRPVIVEPTAGSEANLKQLRSGSVQLAIAQGGSVPLEEVLVVTPLFPELVHVIVRKASGIKTTRDLSGKNVSLGQAGSGTRQTADRILSHLGIDVDQSPDNDAYFVDLLTNPSLDAAIVTAGIKHSDLRQVLGTGEFELLPIDSAAAIAMGDPYLRVAEIPVGLYGSQNVPPTSVTTLATTAFLIIDGDGQHTLVEEVLGEIHEENLRLVYPNLIDRGEATAWIPTRLHPTARRYFSPADDLDFFTRIMESVVAGKELLVALGFGIYLLWNRWKYFVERERRLAERLQEAEIKEKKERLDVFLAKTMEIEAAHRMTTDVTELEKQLDKVTQTKLEALELFTEEQLRGDQTFRVFLDQCSSLINRIQLRMLSQRKSSASNFDEPV
jgi:TRAP transporter TAXI family solute receptor